MRETVWTVLLDKIRRGSCTPFLGRPTQHAAGPVGN